MSNGFDLYVYCEECGTKMKLRGQYLPRFKLCPNCKHKTFFDTPVCFTVVNSIKDDEYNVKKKE